ncbi:MAG: ABC transporter ATP-binding protein [Thermodesulfobacteriota bacterium]|jgi:ABC-type bacteriocin/lantibiotic exporter with double-glycine peptidase domain
MNANLSRFRRLLPFLAPFVRRLVLIFFLSFVGTVLGLLWPLFTKILIDDVLLAKNLRLLFILSGGMILATAAGYAVGALNRYLYTQVTAQVLFALRQHLFAHLQALSLRFHTRAKVGDLLSRLNTDIAEVQTVLTDAAFTFVTNLFVLLATVGFLLWLNWHLFLVSLLVVPLQLYGVYKVRPLMVGETQRVRELNAEISSFLVESLSAIKFIKQFAVERVQLEKLGRLGERFVRTVTRYEMLGYLGSTASTATAFLGGTLTTLYGGYLVIRGHMTIGSLIAFSAYQSRAFSPLQVLTDLYLRIERAGVSLARIFEFLDLDTERGPQPGRGIRPPEVRGAVEFRRVSFAYDGNEPLLCDLNFGLPAGGRLTILGPSGTGKTTVIDLLVRLYDPTGGTILFDGYDVRDLDLAWLRGQIAVVGHEPFLFHASFLDNLRYARPDASQADVVAAAQAVGLHDFVCSLPDGYETVVGERGARLSAGQKQRVALARAVLRQPAVLVLDEALSGLDVVSEASIREMIEALMGGRTVITVTHRLSSVRPDDTVMILERGRVRWEGRYGDLTAVPGDLKRALREWEGRAAGDRRATG